MEIDDWVDGYKVRSFPWIDGENIYMSVSYYAPGQAISKPPVWEKTVYIKDNETARILIKDFLHSVVNCIAELKIPDGGHAKITFN